MTVAAKTRKGRVAGKAGSVIGAAPAPAPAPTPAPAQSQALAARDAMEALRLFASTTESLVPKQSPRPTKFDQYAWALSKAGKSDEEIAALLNCTVLDVRRGVTLLTTWINTVSDEIRNAYANEQIIKGIEGAGKVFQDAQRAERMIAPPVLDKDSGLVLQEAQFIPDHTTRLDATRAVAEFAERLAPKGKGTNINIGNTINNGNGNGAGLSFEARVRALREKRGLRNDEDEIMDAEIIEEEVDGSDGADDVEDGDVTEAADGSDDGAEDSVDFEDAETDTEAAP